MSGTKSKSAGHIITTIEIRALKLYAEMIGDARLATTCAGALLPKLGRVSSWLLMRERCAAALDRVRHEPFYAAALAAVEGRSG